MVTSKVVDCRKLSCTNVLLTDMSYCVGETMAVALHPNGEAAANKPAVKERRVVVTGMGVETPLGHDPDVFYNNLLDGVSGITEIESFDCSQYPTVCLSCGLLFIVRVLRFLF